MPPKSVPCSFCHGTGQQHSDPCYGCDGSGREYQWLDDDCVCKLEVATSIIGVVVSLLMIGYCASWWLPIIGAALGHRAN